MNFNPPSHQRAMFAHYLRLAQSPGWEQYCKDRCLVLASEWPDLFKNFPAKLEQELKRIALARVNPQSQPERSSLP
jgi:hypothetical protein